MKVRKTAIFTLLSVISFSEIHAQVEQSIIENYNDELIDGEYQEDYDFDHSNLVINHNNLFHYNPNKNDIFSTTIIYPKGYEKRNNKNVSALGGIPNPLADTPIDSNLIVLLIAGLCYGFYHQYQLKNNTIG